MKMDFVKKAAAAAMALVLCLSMAACGAGGKDKAYPVSVDGTEIIVGETTMGALYDAGYTIVAYGGSESMEIDATEQLEADSYYSQVFAKKGDENLVMLAVVTEKNAIPISEAVIADVEFFSEEGLAKASFDGVALADLSLDTLKEHVSGISVDEEAGLASMAGNNYTLFVYFENGKVTSLEMKKNYDVDYSS